MSSSFVLFLDALDFRLGIAASLLQIFAGVVKLILIELHLSFSYIDLVLQVIFLRVGGSGELVG